MFNSQRPDLDVLPTTSQLLRSTLAAVLIAAAILFTVVLPAEYAIDPTGVGRLLGLTQMGEIKRQLAQEASLEDEPEAPPVAAPTAPAPAPAPDPGRQPAAAPPAGRSDTMTVSLAPGEGAEIKVWAGKGAEIHFAWTVEGEGHVNYDAHGDPIPRRKGFYHGYGKGKESKGESGVLVAAFDGRHGWFWRNRSTVAVKVTLQTRGEYTEFKRVV